MNIFINTNYVDDFTKGGVEKRFPLIYFWLKDYYFQRAPENFPKTHWYYSDDPGSIRENPELQQKVKDCPPDVIGLSLYMWNVYTLLDNALWVKENVNPNCIIIAAGPNADTREPFMEEYSHVDYFLPGPGAESFKRLIDKLIDNQDPKDVGGICYLNKEGKAVRNPPVPRKDDPLLLDYMTNFKDEVIQLLDEYSAKYDKVIILTMFIQGCPYSCSFCEQGTSLWTKINKRDIKKLFNEIDIISNYPSILLEFADANFGIVPEYEKIVDYVIENGKGNISLKKPPFAKNNVDHTFYLIKKMRDGGVYWSPFDGQISLQDPNPEVLRLNGRPISKEYEKIKAFREYTGPQEHKLAQVEIILGMPHQTWDTLHGSMASLMNQDLLSHSLPYLYLIFPNTVITRPGSEIKIKHRRMKVRRERGWQTGFIDPLDAKVEMDYDHIISTETLTCEELVATHYYWILLCHIYGFLGWLRTPINFLHNHYNITIPEFVKAYTANFHPSKWDELPMNIRFDLILKTRWFKGEDELYQRKSNDSRFWLSPRRVSQFRFHANYDEHEQLLLKTFEQLGVDTSTELFQGMMKWQGSKLHHWYGSPKYKNSLISYNFDDIALAKQEKYYMSQFTFQYPDKDIYKELEAIRDIEWIPHTHHEAIHPSMQKELNLNQQKPLSYYKKLDKNKEIA
jgi:radical SAM superfamily enzyme YgiQ (UPF0313 family)